MATGEWYPYPWYPTHMEQIGRVQGCLHKVCPECLGTGTKIDTKEICVHFISCSCPSCRPHF